MIITPLYAGLLAILFLILSIRVVKRRGQGISLGDGGDAILQRRIRSHGNFAEYVPFILLLMAFLELNELHPYALHALGVSLLAARLLHGIALSFTESWTFGRFYGTLITFILLPVAGGLCLWQSLSTLL